MKFFANSGFGPLTSLFLTLVNVANLSSYVGTVQSSFLLPDGSIISDNIPNNLIPEYVKLLGICNEGGDNIVRGLDPTRH